MANIPNPRKIFNFSIGVAGLNPFLAQEVDTPDFDLDVVEHGDTNHMVPTAGMIKYTPCKVKKISTATGPDNWIWDWQRQCQDVVAGGGDLPSNYVRNIEVVQYAPDGITIINQWELQGAWPKKINNSTFKRTASENTMEDIEFVFEKAVRT